MKRIARYRLLNISQSAAALSQQGTLLLSILEGPSSPHCDPQVCCCAYPK